MPPPPGLNPDTLTAEQVAALKPEQVQEVLKYVEAKRWADEVPYFRGVFDGTIKYRWKRANGETGEHEYRRRIGDIRPLRLRHHFFPDVCVDAKIANLRMLAGDAKPFIARAVELGRKGITMYVEPAPRPELFLPR